MLEKHNTETWILEYACYQLHYVYRSASFYFKVFFSLDIVAIPLEIVAAENPP